MNKSETRTVLEKPSELKEKTRGEWWRHLAPLGLRLILNMEVVASMVSQICFKDRLGSHTKNSSRTWQRFESTEAGKQRGPSGSGEATGSEARRAADSLTLLSRTATRHQEPGTETRTINSGTL